jgi:hypothetical protein
MANSKPSFKKILNFARTVVEWEYKTPTGWSYDRQTVEHEVLNHFDGLTNSDEDYELIVEAIREAENEINARDGVDL